VGTGGVVCGWGDWGEGSALILGDVVLGFAFGALLELEE
jgi:hypothetical protein